MNPITDNFEKILYFAKSYGIPITKKRAILREYLQVKILEKIYQKKISKEIFFVGGTSLRILRGLDRFSEDLDFDTRRIRIETIKSLVKKVSLELKDEKLMIKLDFENFWKDEKEETILVNKYGIIFTAVTINLNQILCQKLYAYLKRKQTLARDIYDIIWLIGQKAKIDNQFLKSNKIQAKKLLDQIKIKFEKEKKSLNSLKQKLAPYLFNEENGSKIFFFKQLIDELK